MRRLSIPAVALAALMAAGAADSASAQDAKDRASDVVCRVEKGGTILSLVPGGIAVKKGDLVCELDASGLNDRLIEETIAVKRAEGEYKTARLAHEAAMPAVKEYQESTYLVNKAAIRCEIKLAESELAQASDHVDEVAEELSTRGPFPRPRKSPPSCRSSAPSSPSSWPSRS